MFVLDAAGYLAAGVTQTGVVGTYGGVDIPTVTIFMDGLARGVAHYNEVKGTDVTVLGWEPGNPDAAIMTGTFDPGDPAVQGPVRFENSSSVRSATVR